MLILPSFDGVPRDVGVFWHRPSCWGHISARQQRPGEQASKCPGAGREGALRQAEARGCVQRGSCLGQPHLPLRKTDLTDGPENYSQDQLSHLLAPACCTIFSTKWAEQCSSDDGTLLPLGCAGTLQWGKWSHISAELLSGQAGFCWSFPSNLC